MAHRRIGQDRLVFSSESAGGQSTLDKLLELSDWRPVERQLRDISSAVRREPAWPPLALFKAMLIAVWHGSSEVRTHPPRAAFRHAGEPVF